MGGIGLIIDIYFGREHPTESNLIVRMPIQTSQGTVSEEPINYHYVVFIKFCNFFKFYHDQFENY